MDLHTLLEVPAGLTVCIREVDAPTDIRSRLCALGITPGTIISTFASSGKDVRRVCVHGSALVLCKAMASCIKCEVVTHDCCLPGCHATPHAARGKACCGGNKGKACCGGDRGN